MLIHARGGRNESAPEFFARVELSHVKQELADLERLTVLEATPDDYVDLGEVEAFSPEVMDGECSA